jgi:hypothetical protein
MNKADLQTNGQLCFRTETSVKVVCRKIAMNGFSSLVV